MSDFTYRPYQPEDAEDIKQMINEAFYIYRYAKAPHLLDSALEVYLRESLVRSTYTEVAVSGGHAVGVLMGQVSGQPRVPRAWANRLGAWAHMVKIVATGFSERKTLMQYFAFDRVYKNLREQTSSPLTDELTLFAVDASTRGHGVGKTLYRNYLEHLRCHGRTDFYLYTDSLCTYQFYEKQGMTRSAEQKMMLDFGDSTEEVGVYLYSDSVR